MYNWSTDEKKFKKDFPWEYKKWRLLQLINYGLDGQKIEGKTLKKLWPQIKEKVTDQLMKRYLESILFSNG